MDIGKRDLLVGVGVLAVAAARSADAAGRGDGRIEVGLYPTSRAVEKGGAGPLNDVAGTVEDALATAAPEAELHVGPDEIVDVDEEQHLRGAEQAFYWWRNNRPYEYADAEILLVSSDAYSGVESGFSWDHGGAAHHDGTAVAMGGDYMDGDVWKRAALHEIGHALGLDHSDGEQWTEDGNVVTSPMTTNMTPDEFRLRYSDRAAEKIRERVLISTDTEYCRIMAPVGRRDSR